MDKEIKHVPLSESHVSSELSAIQQRCKELIESSDGVELSLEDTGTSRWAVDSYNPYDRG